jgi:NitT/TauT family transport system substrate-binding protein
MVSSVRIDPVELAMNLLLKLLLLLCAAPVFAQPVKVTMRLDWKPGAQHASFYYGKERGYFAQEGIDLAIIPGSGSSDSVKQLGSRAVDVALVDALVLVQAAEQRVPVKSIAAYYQRTPITLMSPKAKPVTSVQQLLGDVKLGSKKGSSTYQGLVALLGVNNIKLEQIKLVDIGFGVAPLLVKQVDAIMGFTMNEPIEAETQGMAIHEILIADAGVNAYGLTIASNDFFIAKNGPLLTRFLRATKKAVTEEAQQKQAAIQAVAKAVPEVDVARELKVLDRTLPFYAPKGGDLNSFGTQSEQAWQQTIDTAHKLGLVEKAPQTSAVYNAILLK